VGSCNPGEYLIFRLVELVYPATLLSAVIRTVYCACARAAKNYYRTHDNRNESFVSHCHPPLLLSALLVKLSGIE
jgi:hypothetical protein